jgi:hypothetical protein
MNIGNTRAVYLFHSLWFPGPNCFTWTLPFHLKPPEKRVSRLAEGTPTIDFVGIGAHWKKPRWVIANGEWHPGELDPRVGFLVTNMSKPAENVIAFYN